MARSACALLHHATDVVGARGGGMGAPGTMAALALHAGEPAGHHVGGAAGSADLAKAHAVAAHAGAVPVLAFTDERLPGVRVADASNDGGAALVLAGELDHLGLPEVPRRLVTDLARLGAHERGHAGTRLGTHKLRLARRHQRRDAARVGLEGCFGGRLLGGAPWQGNGARDDVRTREGR